MNSFIIIVVVVAVIIIIIIIIIIINFCTVLNFFAVWILIIVANKLPNKEAVVVLTIWVEFISITQVKITPHKDDICL